MRRAYSIATCPCRPAGPHPTLNELHLGPNRVIAQRGPMRRRTLLQSMLALAATLPIPGVRAWAQAVTFPGLQEDPLKELAATVLPSSLGRTATDAVADEFAAWVRDFREGAEMSPGYGSPRVRYTGSSPAPVYRRQLEQLAEDALSEAELGERRRRLESALDEAGVRGISRIPQGEHVVSDLMSFYFYSTGAHDQAYQARIRKDLCRTLGDSGEVPPPLGGG